MAGMAAVNSSARVAPKKTVRRPFGNENFIALNSSTVRKSRHFVNLAAYGTISLSWPESSILRSWLALSSDRPPRSGRRQSASRVSRSRTGFPCFPGLRCRRNSISDIHRHRTPSWPPQADRASTRTRAILMTSQTVRRVIVRPIDFSVMRLSSKPDVVDTKKSCARARNGPDPSIISVLPPFDAFARASVHLRRSEIAPSSHPCKRVPRPLRADGANAVSHRPRTLHDHSNEPSARCQRLSVK